MQYSEFVDVYEALASTTKRLEKVDILSKLLKKLDGKEEWVYLLRGRVFPDYDESEFGISTQLVIKAISRTAGVSEDKISTKFRKIGDLGDIADDIVGKKKQSTLFSKNLSVDLVFSNLRKISGIEGKGSVDKKMALISELLGNASGAEAKYVVRTLLNDLRVGVADATLRDAIGKAFFEGDKDVLELLEVAYDRVNDFAEVLKSARRGKKSLEKVELIPGRPIKVMLPVKVIDLEEAFRICGKPLAVEHKYDGFRVLINYDGKEVSLFTRKLDNVTKQFPDVVEAVKKYVMGKSFVLDSEVVGYTEKNSKRKYEPFEAISQRIRRKYDISDLVKKLPVEINVFDIIYHNGKSVIEEPFTKRRKLLEKIITEKKWKIRLSTQFVSDDEKKIMKFYKDALRIGEEGVMFKKLDAPYRPGRRVGYMVKMKPADKDLDLVIVGAEYGTGKRSGGLTSYIVACSNGNKFLEVGKVSSGLKEKEEMGGITYTEMDKLLKPLIIHDTKTGVVVKPKIIVSVTYQNIQPSPRYSSGFAMRFPRITHYRPERGLFDIATLSDIKKERERLNKRNKQRGLG
jgi:DNA ligase 1